MHHTMMIHIIGAVYALVMDEEIVSLHYSILARIRLLGRFTTCLVQTTTASRLLFALGWHFMPREYDFF